MDPEALNAEFDRKVRKGIFRPVARYLTNESTAEDRLQDAVSQTWQMYHRYAREKGNVLSDAILVHYCRRRAVDLDRHFVPADCCRRKDVLDPRAYRDGRVEVHHLDGILDDQESEGDHALQVGLAEVLAPTPERKLNSALDLKSWLRDLSRQEREILKGKLDGFTIAEIASDLGLNSSKVFQEAKRLGLDLAARAGVNIDFSKEKRGGGRTRSRRRSRGIDVAMVEAEASAA